jgi:uncharacterized repeat protein (TIGR03803 family)
LVQATTGVLYGVTNGGGTSISGGVCGSSGCGTIFKTTLSGTLTTLYDFNGTDGREHRGLIQAPNGDFYGVANSGGSSGQGMIFKMPAAGTLATLASFDGTNGSYPVGIPVQATNGDFYGAMLSGGANSCL